MKTTETNTGQQNYLDREFTRIIDRFLEEPVKLSTLNVGDFFALEEGEKTFFYVVTTKSSLESRFVGHDEAQMLLDLCTGGVSMKVKQKENDVLYTFPEDKIVRKVRIE